MINHDQLELQVIMSNAGLPEAGDAVLTFPEEIVADPQKYRAAVALPVGEGEIARAQAARARRDLAIEGYGQLLEGIVEHGRPALERFYTHAVDLVRPLIGDWQHIWEHNVQMEAEQTRAQLDALASGDRRHLSTATVIRGEPRPGPRLWGMCGRLQTWSGEV
ncbi:hypothetical protein H4W26_001514 [Nesterenkonia halotolerans]|uniref:Uncharacterized protein n=1 Tax=Nesterenkonia halotolerans TaxID=225325 RepID=A0ABR9J6Y6_9MICC|nr:hypothetical protein [Nesterenkonia halotolerans]